MGERSPDLEGEASEVRLAPVERRERGRRLHVRTGLGILSERLKICPAAPLGIIDNLGAIEPAMNTGRYKARHMLHGALGRLDEEGNEFLLILWRDRKYVHESDNVAPFYDRGHRILISDWSDQAAA